MEFLEKFLDSVISEYGLFVTVLLIVIVFQGGVIRILWKRNVEIADQLLVALVDSTTILTKLESRIKEHD